VLVVITEAWPFWVKLPATKPYEVSLGGEGW
jgi:hypothetical protein